MKRKITVLAFCAMLFALCLPAQAQQQAKIPKIGWLDVRPPSAGSGRELFAREFRALGYVEGKNIAFEFRNADNKLDRLPALADELVGLKVDVLFTPAGSEATCREESDENNPNCFCGRR